MEFIGRVEDFIGSHPNLVVSVGLPLMVLAVTALVSHMSARANIRSQEQQRKLSHQLKLADYRQEWINGLREDFAIYTARTFNADLNSGTEAMRELVSAHARILMRMNPSDPDYQLLSDSLLSPIADKQSDREALFQVGQRILKREWNRIKSDLNAVEDDQK